MFKKREKKGNMVQWLGAQALEHGKNLVLATSCLIIYKMGLISGVSF
jgi:hypothetical protein